MLRAYGVGNVPSDEPGLTDVIADVLHDGVPVVIASQCQQAEVLLGHYETGDAIARAGAIGSGDMTLEATYAKIMFLLSQGPEPTSASGCTHRLLEKSPRARCKQSQNFRICLIYALCMADSEVRPELSALYMAELF